MKKIVNLKASEFLSGGIVQNPLNTKETDKEIHIPFSEDEIKLMLEKVDIVFIDNSTRTVTLPSKKNIFQKLLSKLFKQ